MNLQLTTTKALQFYQVCRQGAGILTGVLLAKTGLSTGAIGIFELLLYIGTTVSFFWVNGLLQGIVPIHNHLSESEQKPFLFNVFLTFAAIAGSIWLLLFLGESWAVPWLTGLETIPHYFLFITYLLLNLLSFPTEIFYLLKNNAKAIVWWALISFGLHLLLLSIPLFLGYGLDTVFQILIVFALIRALWTFVLTVRLGEVRFRWDLIKIYIAFAFPLILNAMLGHLVPLFDNWLVGQWFQDESTFAIFRYGAREFPIALALSTALATSTVVPLSIAWKKGKFTDALPDFKAKTTKLMHLIFPLSILTMLLSKKFFPIIFNPDFADSAIIFNVYLLIVASRVLLPNTLILARGKSQVIFWVAFFELLVKVVLGYVFIEKWGLIGVAYSAVLAYFFEKIYLALFLYFREGIKVQEWLNLGWYIPYFILLCTAYYAA